MSSELLCSINFDHSFLRALSLQRESINSVEYPFKGVLLSFDRMWLYGAVILDLSLFCFHWLVYFLNKQRNTTVHHLNSSFSLLLD